MKHLFYIAVLCVLPFIAYSQEQTSEQNPRHKESLDRYIKLIDSLTMWQGVTIQNTYKAYDWREAREERRKQRREWRHQERLTRIRYNDYYRWDNDFYYWPNYYPYSNGYYPNLYNNRWKRFHFDPFW